MAEMLRRSTRKKKATAVMVSHLLTPTSATVTREQNSSAAKRRKSQNLCTQNMSQSATMHINDPGSSSGCVSQHGLSATTSQILPYGQQTFDVGSGMPAWLPQQQPDPLCPTSVVTQSTVGSICSTGNTDTLCTYSYEPSVNDDIALHVPLNVQEKIQKGEYIDLSSLLISKHETDEQTVVFIQDQLVIKPKKQQVTITTIEQWSSAFIVYMYVYCKVHSSRCLELLKYMQMIRLGASRSIMGWKSYDEKFRLRKARNPPSSWAIVDYELWILYMNRESNSTSDVHPIPNNNQSQLKCYSFNFEGFCTKQSCIYRNACIRCSGGHPVINCPNKQTHNMYVTPPPARGGSQSNTNYQQRFRFPGRPQAPTNTFRPRNSLAGGRPTPPISSLGFRQNTYPRR